MNTSSSTFPQFENAIQILSEIVSQMEKGDLSLEDSLKKFEQGVQLIRQCQTLLHQAEQRIQLYNKESNSLKPFDNNLEE